MESSFPEFDATLRDGRAVRIRAMRPEDEAELLQAFERMSDEARYMRFMRHVREPDMRRVRKLLASFPEGGIGIVATVPAEDGIDIVGSAICVVGADPTSCEFAINVTAAFGGTGLGTMLMNTLIGLATKRGLREMIGFVLAENQPMLRLARRLGFDVAPEPGDWTVRNCRLQLRGA